MVTHIVKRPSAVASRTARPSVCLVRMKLSADDRKAIEAALTTLPKDHPAREAHAQGTDPVMLIHLIEEDSVQQAIEDAWFAAYRRHLSIVSKRQQN